MTSNLPPIVGRAAVVLVLALGLVLSACSASSSRRAGAPVRGPQPRASDSMAGELPSLPVTQVETGAPDAQRVYLDVQGQELAVVLRDLATKMGLGYQIDPSVRGMVSTRLQGLTLTQALDALVLPHGYTYSLQGNLLRVAPTSLRTEIFSLDYLSLSRFGTTATVVQRQLTGSGGQQSVGGGAATGGMGGLGGGLGGGGDAITSVTVADIWSDLRITLEGLLFENTVQQTGGSGDAGSGLAGGQMNAPGAFSRVEGDGRRLVINPMSGTILVTASAEQLANVKAYVSTVEASVQRQVVIEAKIVEVLLDRQFEFGIDWGEIQNALSQFHLQLTPKEGGAGSATFGLANPASVSVMLRALDRQGEVRVLSSPQVSALNNQRAVINVSTDQVFFSITRQPIIGPNGGTIGFSTEVQPQQIAVGIVLNVLPQISAQNVITMNVHPVITDVLEVKEIQVEGTSVSAPVLDRRETDTVVRARDGETVVMGGLMQTRSERQRKGIPILMDLPVVGGLFGFEVNRVQTRELVIFLTPTVVAGQAAANF